MFAAGLLVNKEEGRQQACVCSHLMLAACPLFLGLLPRRGKLASTSLGLVGSTYVERARAVFALVKKLHKHFKLPPRVDALVGTVV